MLAVPTIVVCMLGLEMGRMSSGVSGCLFGQSGFNLARLNLKDRLPQVIADHLGFDEGEDDTLEFAKSLGGQISRGYAYFNADRRFWGDII